jgi:hypothetical protein
MHSNTSDGAEKALAGLAARQPAEVPKTRITRDFEKDIAAAKKVGLRTAKDQDCPDCGWPVINWWSGNQLDPGDVDPRADCTNPDCGWGY